MSMKKPPKRRDIPPRDADNNKRRLLEPEEAQKRAQMLADFQYEGSSKHKKNPHLFKLAPFQGDRGDRTLCDRDADFLPQDAVRIPILKQRALNAALVGTRIWTVDDNGWIYELAVTNAVQMQYHGYPVRPSEAIAEPVFRRFWDWAERHGAAADKKAAAACKSRYRIEE